MVLNCMDSLQLRVPGANVLLVVTHIDCVPWPEVERQVQWVHKLVQEKLQEFIDDDDGEGAKVSRSIVLTVKGFRS